MQLPQASSQPARFLNTTSVLLVIETMAVGPWFDQGYFFAPALPLGSG
jgi:hypothetical protein